MQPLLRDFYSPVCCRVVLLLLWVVLAFSTGGCSTVSLVPQPGHEQRIVWPAPPLEPRIEWVKEIRHHKDLGIQPGFWQRLIGFIAGEREERFLRPYGMAARSGHRFVAVDSGAAQVHLVDLAQGRYQVLPEADTIALLSPIAVTEDDGGNLYISDSGAGQIYRYGAADGNLTPLLNYRLKRPTGLSYNRWNRLLYVAETGEHQIVGLDLSGMEQFRFGGKGNSPGLFNFPTDLTTDQDGRVVVTDALNGRIQILEPDGKPVSIIGEPGNSPGRFARPKGVALDSDGHIYVCDSQQDMVQVFDPQGRLLLAFGENGSGPGQFWMPSGIFIDHDTIYVADTYNQRIQVFKYLKAGRGSRDPHALD